MRRVVIVLVQVILKAALFSAGDWDELFKVGFYKVDLIRISSDIGNKSEFGYFSFRLS